MRCAYRDLVWNKIDVTVDTMLYRLSVEGTADTESRSSLWNNGLTAFRHLRKIERRKTIEAFLIKRREDLWGKTSIGELGYQMADDLEPIIRGWVEANISPEIWPGDLANIAREVVEVICEQHRSHAAYVNNRLAARRRAESQ